MTTPRIAPQPEAGHQPDHVATLDRLRAPDGSIPNLFATLARHRLAFQPAVRLWMRLLFRGTLPDRDRELAILRVAHRTSCPYELHHHVRIAAEAGLTGEQIAAVDPAHHTKGLDDDQRSLLDAVDELLDSDDISDPRWRALAGRYDDAQLIELVLLVGQYRAIALLINSCRVELDLPATTAQNS